MKRAWPAMLLALVLNAVSSSAFALNPRLNITQYGHTVWRIRDGFFPGPIVALTQTRDGYIWLATTRDLIRFDGVRFEVWKPPSGSSLAAPIVSVFGSTDGSLWIGETGALQRWQNGTLTTLTDTGRFEAFAEDADGTVWTGNTRSARPMPPLCRVAHGRFWCVGRGDTVPLSFITSLYVAGDGAVWAGGDGAACRFFKQKVECFPIAALGEHDMYGVRELSSDPAGRVIASTNQFGFWRFESNRWMPLHSPLLSHNTSEVMLRDGEGSLWIGTSNGGLIRMTASRTDTFGTADGLTGDSVIALYEDTEHDVWVVTSGGVERFRDVAMATITKREGLLEDTVTSVAPARNGGVWITHAHEGVVGIAASGTVALRAGHELPAGHFNSVLEDARGRLWIGTNDGLGWLERGRLVPVRTPDGLPFGVVLAILDDSDGHVWVSTTDPKHALVRITDGVVSEVIDVNAFGGQVVALAQNSRGGVWIGVNRSPNGRVGELFRHKVGGTSPLSVVALKTPPVRNMFSDHDGLWVGTRDGLLWIHGDDGSAISALDEHNGLPCAGVAAIARLSDGSLLFNASCGLVSVSPADMHRWMSDPSIRTQSRIRDAYDGALSTLVSPFAPKAARSSDGRVWFVAPNVGIQIVDPARLQESTRLPPVLVTGVVADRKAYGVMPLVTLPVRAQDLEIRYTALSYKIPERVRFRYRLDGVDADWQDAGTRREAFYMNLKPGRYRFRVVATNDAGVWNNSGASVELLIPPAFVQTTAFNLLVAGFLAILLWSAYRMRLRSVTRTIQGRMEERLYERERIARELHDTLLQGTYGLVLRFQAVADQIDPAHPVRQSIEAALERADKVMAEGRDRVEGLRAADAGEVDLAAALKQSATEVSVGDDADLRVAVEGQPRAMLAIVRDEVFWVGREAIANALHAAQATRIDVTLVFDRRELRLTVHDDGRGIESAVLDAGGRPKHWGIRGMRERAARVGGRLNITSQPNSGTTVELRIPARLAYARDPATSKPWFRRKAVNQE